MELKQGYDYFNYLAREEAELITFFVHNYITDHSNKKDKK